MRSGSRWRAYGLDDRGYLPLEAEASTVRDFTVTYVPGLLQTADYARALFEASFRRRSSEILERDVTVRMIRQERLTSADRALELFAVIEESVLHRPVGGTSVMRAQLEHLVAVAALDTVTVQVLPTGVVAHPGIDGAFTVLSFDGLGEPDTGYVEHPMGSVHVEKEEDVTRARLVFDHLRTVARSPAESVALSSGWPRRCSCDRERCPMLAVDPAGNAWRKSSFSGGNGGGDGCVEVAVLSDGEVAVRDTKDRSRTPHRHSAPAWREFLSAVRAGEFDA